MIADELVPLSTEFQHQILVDDIQIIMLAKFICRI